MVRRGRRADGLGRLEAAGLAEGVVAQGFLDAAGAGAPMRW